MPRPSNKSQRRAEIIAGLLQVIGQQGYEKATIQSIAKAAGLSPGLIHYHFKNKMEILLALIDWIAQEGAARLETLDQGHSAYEQLEAFIEARLGEGATASPELVTAWVTIAAEAVHQEEVREAFQELLLAQKEFVECLLSEAASEAGKDLTANAISDLSAAIMALMEGAFLLEANTSGVMPSDYAKGAAMALVSKHV